MVYSPSSCFLSTIEEGHCLKNTRWTNQTVRRGNHTQFMFILQKKDMANRTNNMESYRHCLTHFVHKCCHYSHPTSYVSYTLISIGNIEGHTTNELLLTTRPMWSRLEMDWKDTEGSPWQSLVFDMLVWGRKSTFFLALGQLQFTQRILVSSEFAPHPHFTLLAQMGLSVYRGVAKNPKV